MPTTRTRLTAVWLFLAGVTAAAWWLASSRGHREFSPSAAVTVGILAAAAIKARLIIRHFMDVRGAPSWLRNVTDGWLLLLVGTTVALYAW